MTDYICNDCEEGEEFTGNCKLSLPSIAGKPKYCPIFDGHEFCLWKEQHCDAWVLAQSLARP